MEVERTRADLEQMEVQLIEQQQLIEAVVAENEELSGMNDEMHQMLARYGNEEEDLSKLRAEVAMEARAARELLAAAEDAAELLAQYMTDEEGRRDEKEKEKAGGGAAGQGDLDRRADEGVDRDREARASNKLKADLEELQDELERQRARAEAASDRAEQLERMLEAEREQSLGAMADEGVWEELGKVKEENRGLVLEMERLRAGGAGAGAGEAGRSREELAGLLERIASAHDGDARLAEALDTVGQLAMQKQELEEEMVRKSQVLARAKSFLRQYVGAAAGAISDGDGPSKEMLS